MRAAPIAAAPAVLAKGTHKWLTLAVVALGVLMVMVDSTVVNVALPSIRQDFGFLDVSVTELQWVVNAYALSFAVLLLTAGRLADLFGRRLIFMIGIAVFVGASIACGLAPDITTLIGFRAVQGIGAALITPTSLSIITVTFEAEERGLAIGVWSGIVGIGVALGPLLGGLLTEYLDWRWVFFINVPVGIIALAGALVYVRESRDPSLERRLDWAGVVLSALSLFALTYALLTANDHGWSSALTLGLLAVAVMALVGFIVVERAQRVPMLDLSLFRSTTFSGANATAVFVGFALFGLLFFGSLLMQNVMGYSAVQTGAALLPMMALMMVATPIVGKLTDRVGPRWFLSGGMGLLAIGLAFLATLGFESTYWDLLPALIFGGIGFALVLTPLTSAALAGVPARHAGIGAAVINSTRQAGGSLGLAVMGAILAEQTTAALQDGETSLEGFVDGFHVIMLTGAAVCLVGAVVAALTVTRARPAAAPAVPEQLRVQNPTSWAVSAPSVVRAFPEAVGQAAGARTGPHLEVVAGPATGTRISIGDEPFVVGRAADGAGTLGDDPRLSRRHARVSRRDGHLVIEDLNSTNGTFLNGRPVQEATPADPGDSIELGVTTLRVLAPPAAPAPVPDLTRPVDLGVMLEPTRISVAMQPTRISQSFGPTMEVVTGPAAGTDIAVGYEPLVFGRAETGAGKLGGDPELSRRHASVSSLDAGRLLLEDLASTNGTFLNGNGVFAPTVVAPGDEIRMGTSSLRVVGPAGGAGPGSLRDQAQSDGPASEAAQP